MTDQQTRPTELPERLALGSKDITQERIEQLRQLFPEVFREGKIDFAALQRSLGEWVDPGKERFGLQWPGKANCMRVIQTPSQGTLVPQPDESVDAETTQNIVIEGDNLEVLKLLQNAYYGKVKMIYIDPPYNTGNDFIYPDDYREGLQGYLRYSGQLDENGRKLTTNPDTQGRFHSRWLNMMYPRLFLARNLLREDGVIFVSIDDNEVHHLRLLMNEIFGEENFVAQFIWRTRTGSNDARNFVSSDHEYVVCFATHEFTQLVGLAKSFSDYSNPDNDPRGPWTRGDLTCNKTKDERPNLYYPLTDPATGVTYPCNPNRVWAYEKERMARLIAEGKVLFPRSGSGTPGYKRYLSELRSERKPISTLLDVPINAQATRQLREVMGAQVFDYPKGPELLTTLIRQATTPSNSDIVLDFFAGSGTTGHAVMKLNQEDGGNRRYILVQLPEPVENDGPYQTVADITRERLRRAGRQIRQQATAEMSDATVPVDTGFRAYRLTTSNFRQWDGNLRDDDSVTRNLELFTDNVLPDRTDADILTEILLTTGFDLAEPVETLTLAGKTVYSVADGVLLVCLDRSLTLEVIEAMADRDPAQIICLDVGFGGNDQLKVNAVQSIKVRARQHDATITLRVI